jgi:hypothetical protein
MQVHRQASDLANRLCGALANAADGNQEALARLCRSEAARLRACAPAMAPLPGVAETWNAAADMLDAQAAHIAERSAA